MKWVLKKEVRGETDFESLVEKLGTGGSCTVWMSSDSQEVRDNYYSHEDLLSDISSLLGTSDTVIGYLSLGAFNCLFKAEKSEEVVVEVFDICFEENPHLIVKTK